MIGCDSRVSGNSGQILTDSDEKWLIGGSFVATCAGSIGGLWYDLRKAPPTTFAAFREATTDLDAVLGHDRDYELLVYDRRGDVLWHTDHGGEALRQGHVLAIGCGAAYAYGVVDAAKQPRTLAQAETLVRRALSVACKRHSACGGRLRVIVCERRKPARVV